MVYPDIHPKAEEIKTKKTEIDSCYKRIIDLEEQSRNAYKSAMEYLRIMGESHREMHQTLRKTGELMNELKSLIDSPRI